MRCVALRHQDDSSEGGGNGQPYGPRGHDAQKHHDDGYQGGVEEHERGGKPRGYVVVGLEEEYAAARVEEPEGEQYAGLLPGDLEALPAQQQEYAQDCYGEEVAEEEYGFGVGAVLHQWNGKQGVQSVTYSGDDAGRVAYDGVLAEGFHIACPFCWGANIRLIL